MAKHSSLKIAGGDFCFQLISAILDRGDIDSDFIEESMSAEKFINLLQKLSQDTGCPIFVIVIMRAIITAKKYRSFWILSSARS